MLQVDARERRVVQKATEVLRLAMLGSREGSGDALFGLVKTLFPEYEEQGELFKKRGEQILEEMGEAPIAVVPFASLESSSAERFRKVRVQSKGINVQEPKVKK